MSQLFCFRALKLGVDAVARRPCCVRAMNSAFFVFFNIGFCLICFFHVIRGTRHCTKQNANGTVDHDLWCRELVQRGRLQVQDPSGILKLGCPMANQRSSANWVMCRKTTKSPNYFPEGIVWLPIYGTACFQFPCNVILRSVFLKAQTKVNRQKWTLSKFCWTLAQAKRAQRSTKRKKDGNLYTMMWMLHALWLVVAHDRL